MPRFAPLALRPGDLLRSLGNTCQPEGRLVTVCADDEGRPFVTCDDGVHMLDADGCALDFEVLQRTLTVTGRQLEILRDAMVIAYCDDDAPIYDRPDGEASVAELNALLRVADAPPPADDAPDLARQFVEQQHEPLRDKPIIGCAPAGLGPSQQEGPLRGHTVVETGAIHGPDLGGQKQHQTVQGGELDHEDRDLLDLMWQVATRPLARLHTDPACREYWARATRAAPSGESDPGVQP